MQILGRIWLLSDLDGDNMLNAPEFLIAMTLIVGVSKCVHSYDC